LAESENRLCECYPHLMPQQWGTQTLDLGFDALIILDRWQVVLLSEDKLSFTDLHPKDPVSYPEMEQQMSTVQMITWQTVCPVILRTIVR
jgi:hypothetical protein